MQLLDYHNAYFIYSSATEGVPDNTCRVQILAQCTLTDSDTPRKFYLGKECIGEYCYNDDQGIAQVPTSEVSLIFCEGPTALIKKFADHANDVLQITDMNESRVGFDGSRSHVLSMDPLLRFAAARPLTTATQIIEATIAGEAMVGRTTLGHAVLEYPIPYINVHPPIDRFQVDIGPILLPGADVDPPVARFDLAYVMFNTFDTAEFAVRVPTRLGDYETLHYSEVRRISAINELFGMTG